MLVKIRLRRGPTVKRNTRKNRRVALACAALLTPAALMACVLGVWRLGADVGAARQFAIASGLFSHWQVWLGAAALLQAAAIVLNRYGNASNFPAGLPKSEESPARAALPL